MARVRLRIACAINDDYALPLVVTLISLKEHLRPLYEPVLYLMRQSVSNDFVACISRLVETHSLVPNQESVAAIPSHTYFPPEAAYPLLLPELVPETLDRILFLDADLLVLDDVAKTVGNFARRKRSGGGYRRSHPTLLFPKGSEETRRAGHFRKRRLFQLRGHAHSPG
jgi:hypothetical protein